MQLLWGKGTFDWLLSSRGIPRVGATWCSIYQEKLGIPEYLGDIIYNHTTANLPGLCIVKDLHSVVFILLWAQLLRVFGGKWQKHLWEHEAAGPGVDQRWSNGGLGNMVSHKHPLKMTPSWSYVGCTNSAVLFCSAMSSFAVMTTGHPAKGIVHNSQPKLL